MITSNNFLCSLAVYRLWEKRARTIPSIVTVGRLLQSVTPEQSPYSGLKGGESIIFHPCVDRYPKRSFDNQGQCNNRDNGATRYPPYTFLMGGLPVVLTHIMVTDTDIGVPFGIIICPTPT